MEPLPYRSAIYEGRVIHHRTTPVDHRFTYQVAMVLLDLAEIDEICTLHPLWSAESRNVISYRRSDYLGDPRIPLDEAVRTTVAERLGSSPQGPIAVLTHLRTWGWLFNPITTYYCYDDDGQTVEAVVVEVTNTPWHERTAYVLPGAGTHQTPKGLHVSPFLPMDLVHRFTIGTPGPHLILGIDDFRSGDGPDEDLEAAGPVFRASLAMRRRAISRSAMGRLVWRHPFMTTRVSAGIYRQAAALAAKRVPFQKHPAKVAASGSMMNGEERTRG